VSSGFGNSVFAGDQNQSKIIDNGKGTDTIVASSGFGNGVFATDQNQKGGLVSSGFGTGFDNGVFAGDQNQNQNKIPIIDNKSSTIIDNKSSTIIDNKGTGTAVVA